MHALRNLDHRKPNQRRQVTAKPLRQLAAKLITGMSTYSRGQMISEYCGSAANSARLFSAAASASCCRHVCSTKASATVAQVMTFTLGASLHALSAVAVTIPRRHKIETRNRRLQFGCCFCGRYGRRHLAHASAFSCSLQEEFDSMNYDARKLVTFAT